MKKKLLLGLLTVSMVLSMAACGGESDKDDDDKKNKASVEASVEKDDEKEAESKEAESKEAESKEAESKEAESKETESTAAATKEAESKEAESKAPASAEAEINEELVGEWLFSYDGSEDLSASIGMDIEFVFDIAMDFRADGSLGVSVDEESLSAASENLEGVMLTYTVDTVYKQLAESGISKEQADETFKTTYGKSVEDYCKEQLAAMDISAMLGGVAAEYTYEGAWKVDGDKLYVVESADKAFTTYEVYRIEGDTLILESPDGSTGSLGGGVGYPMELKRK